MQVQGSDCLDYEQAIKKARQLIKEGEDINFALLVICGVNMGLRISDLLKIDYSQLKAGKFLIEEKKTGKKRKIVANSCVREAVNSMPDSPQKTLGGKCFLSNRGGVYSPQQINRLLKKHFSSDDLKISSHSLRKSFGRRYYELKKEEGGLSKLQMQFNHATPFVTLRYIGVTQENLDDMYEDIT